MLPPLNVSTFLLPLKYDFRTMAATAQNVIEVIFSCPENVQKHLRKEERIFHIIQTRVFDEEVSSNI